MATIDKAHDTIVLSDDEARSGVTGHNVRYVLAFGMTGVIAAFAAIAIYFGFDQLEQRAATAMAQSPLETLRMLAPYAAILLGGAIAGGLLLGLWSLIAGRSGDDSQAFMRARVVAQFAAICIIMAMLYISVA